MWLIQLDGTTDKAIVIQIVLKESENLDTAVQDSVEESESFVPKWYSRSRENVALWETLLVALWSFVEQRQMAPRWTYDTFLSPLVIRSTGHDRTKEKYTQLTKGVHFLTSSEWLFGFDVLMAKHLLINGKKKSSG